MDILHLGQRLYNSVKKIPLYTPFTTYKKCGHYQEPVKAGDYTVLVSGYRSTPNELKAPDAGVYLDPAWSRPHGAMTVSPGTEWPQIQGWYPAIYVDWPDWGTIHIENMALLSDWILDHLQAGERVEVGCIGSHGRTGTFLACLIVDVERLSAKEAIEAVRERHCNKAIESSSQEDMVYEYAGEEPPVRPKKQWGTTTVVIPGKGIQHPDEGDPQEWEEEWWQGTLEGTGWDDDLGKDDGPAQCGEEICDIICHFAGGETTDGRIYCNYFGEYVQPTPVEEVER